MRLFTLTLVALLVACSEPDQATAPAEPVTDWRVLIQLPEAELPVRLHLAPDGSEAWFANGPERVEVGEIARAGEGWVLRFPVFNNTVTLRPTAAGFEGELTLVKRGYEQVMPLTAAPHPGYRFIEDPQPEVDVTGRWSVTFTEDDGAQSEAVGEFDQQGSSVVGTFLTAKGDYRYLAGDVDGRRILLSTFDGAHAFVFSAELRADGTLEGDFWSGTKWHEDWVAERNFEARLPDAYQLTYLNDGYDRLEFTFPDLDGKPVSLSDERFRDKVVLVSLAGSWCPNCADEMAFLAPVYRENRDRGLEMVTLLYEHFEDFERAARQGRAMAQKHGAEWKMLVAGISDKTAAAETLPMLNHVLAFPTLIFIDRNGAVRHIHTGFSGPGTGQHYQAFKEKFETLLESLLQEPASAAP
ncbi:MAG: TlpA family protein disulfide reductase [Xanthomonadales bacterium]|nr:TlpA family protein disulfide reductase [Xanthomonadales bacterium]